VVRDGSTHAVDADQVVPGDLLLVQAGDRVTADGRIVTTNDLEVNEASLTGESLPTAKRREPPVRPDAPLAERTTMVFAGSTVTDGGARVLVTATGPRTEVGRALAAATATRRPPTPLQERLSRFAALILQAILVLCAVLAVLAWVHGEDLTEAVRIGIALAVAAVPEGLPAVLTVALAVGVQRMARRNAIVRRLPAVETLGSTTVICTDKTGTVTEGQMTVGRLFPCATGRKPKAGNAPLGPAEAELLRASVMASQQSAGPLDLPDPATLPPTEAAIAQAARDLMPDWRSSGGRVVRVLPFDSRRKRMSVVLQEAQRSPTAYVKGAPESVIPRLAVDRRSAQALAERSAEWARVGTRVLLVARRALEGDADPETDLERLGLIGLFDPPRPGVADAVAEAGGAGVRTVLVTGDHPGTAEAIAESVGIREPGSRAALTGPQIDRVGDTELEEVVGSTSVFARVTPEHKVRIVGALGRRGEVVAMTGDGVNDVPALRAAHIGVAMGQRGTDAAKDASDMVLADDDYSTIVAAIRRGRSIYENIVRFVHFLVAANAGEVLAFTLAIAIGLPAPLTVVQILLVNLLTNGPPAVAVGFDPPGPGLMDRPPRPPREPLLAPIRTPLVIGGLTTGAVTLAAFLLGYAQDQATGQTMAFTALVLAQLAYVFAVRASGWPPLAGRNPILYGAVAVSVAIVVAMHAVPPLRDAFDLVTLGANQLIAIAGLAFIPFATLMAFKTWRRDTAATITAEAT
jgi:P-type Ca2+ transporter type 2C